MNTIRRPARQVALIVLAVIFLLVAFQVKYAQDSYERSVHQYEESQQSYEQRALEDSVSTLMRGYTLYWEQDPQNALQWLIEDLEAHAQQDSHDLWIDRLETSAGGQIRLTHEYLPMELKLEQESLDSTALEAIGMTYAQQQLLVNEGGVVYTLSAPLDGQSDARLLVYAAYDAQSGIVLQGAVRMGYISATAAAHLQAQARDLQRQILWVVLTGVIGYVLILLVLLYAQGVAEKLRIENEQRLNEKEAELSKTASQVEKTYNNLMRNGLLDGNVMHNHASLSNWLDEHFELFTSKSSEAILTGQAATALALVELDDMLEINQQYGLEAGDMALSMLSELLEQKIRKSDIVARWHEATFLIVLNNISLKNALARIEDLRACVEKAPLEYAGNSFLVTVTGGVTMVLENDKNWKQAHSRAQRALARGREASKNTICHEIFQ